MKNPALLCGLLLAIAGAAGPVWSEAVTLDCRVQSTKPGYSRRGIRRLVIDQAAKTVQVSDNTGKGFQLRGSRPLVGVTADRYVLENGGGKTAFVDRRSGQYMFKNDAEKLTIQGRCAKASAGMAKF